jgi:hypothetical protein
VDKTELVKEKREEGEALVRELDRIHFPISSAFWFRLEDTGEWRLILASPIVKDKGPDFAYQKIQEALSSLTSPVTTKLTDIWLVKETEPVVRALAISFKTPKQSISNVDMYNCTTSGVYVSGAHVYRAAPNS